MDSPGSEHVERLERAFLAVDLVAARAALARAAQELGTSQALEAVLVSALEHLGDRWSAGTASLSQVYMAGRHAETLSRELMPAEAPVASEVRLGVAVLEDQHVLGKRMVLAHLRAAGYRPLDLGEGLTGDALAERVVAERLGVVLVSTLMLRGAQAVAPFVARLRSLGSGARVVVGGAPFRLDRALWRSTGADACGFSASDAVRLVAELGGAP